MAEENKSYVSGAIYSSDTDDERQGEVICCEHVSSTEEKKVFCYLVSIEKDIVDHKHRGKHGLFPLVDGKDIFIVMENTDDIKEYSRDQIKPLSQEELKTLNKKDISYGISNYEFCVTHGNSTGFTFVVWKGDLARKIKMVLTKYYDNLDMCTKKYMESDILFADVEGE